MKMNKKGFTLIELLAVIVILAVIALIAVPQILNILNNARKSAAEDSAYGILEAAETFAATYMLENHGYSLVDETQFECKDSTCKMTDASKTKNSITADQTLSFSGTKPSAGVIELDAEGNAKISASTPLTINNFSCTNDTEDEDIINCELS